MNYSIAIPSYHREHTVQKKTLKVLESYNIDPANIKIFVNDVEEGEYPQFEDRTPNTKRKLIHEEKVSEIKKLGTIGTAFTIFKGFVCTGVLYLPKDIYNGGWLFSSFTLVFFCFMTLYCAKLLIEVADKVGGGSFSDIGFKAAGKWGKIAVDASLVGSQTGFTCAYIYFIALNIN